MLIFNFKSQTEDTNSLIELLEKTINDIKSNIVENEIFKIVNTKTIEYKIEQIKYILNEYVMFGVTTEYFELEKSPVYNIVDDRTDLIETFFPDNVEVVSYDSNGNELDAFEVSYEELDEKNIDFIYNLLVEEKTKIDEIFKETQSNE